MPQILFSVAQIFIAHDPVAEKKNIKFLICQSNHAENPTFFAQDPTLILVTLW